MKNLISEQMFGMPYNELPLASEVIADLHMKIVIAVGVNIMQSLCILLLFIALLC